MAGKSRFSIAKEDIKKHFDQLSSKYFSEENIGDILDENRAFWRLTQSLKVSEFIELLVKHTKLEEHKFSFPARSKSRTTVRYSWGEPSLFGLALSLKNNSYLSHYTALYLHGLTEQIPKSIYVTHEQPKKEGATRAELKQENIDYAFSRPPRLSENVTTLDDYRIYLLNGKHSNNLGVITQDLESETALPVTNLERTLIDIVVRPAYSGGVSEVLKAYTAAADRVSINKLVAMLKRLDFIYPYHQCIGFYLEKAGNYSESQIAMLRKMPIDYDFYLVNEMEDKAYSPDWKLYYPKGLYDR